MWFVGASFSRWKGHLNLLYQVLINKVEILSLSLSLSLSYIYIYIYEI